MRGIFYMVENLKFIPIKQDGSESPASEDLPFIKMIETVQKEKAFYFSYEIDLTHNMQQSLLNIVNGKTRTPSQEQSYQNMKVAYPNSVDNVKQYVFNHALLQEFGGIEYSPFRVPCIFGYVYISFPQFRTG